MLRKLVRILKGQYMLLMYCLFFIAILVGVLLVVPTLWLVERLQGPNPDRMQWVNRQLMRFWLLGLACGRLLTARHIRGRLHDGPCVVVANHPGLFDILVLIRDIPRLSLMVKRTLASRLPLGPIFRRCAYVLSPHPDSPGSAMASAREAIETLKSGYKFMLFPESRRSPKGDLLRFSAGAFRIAHKAGVPIQPVFIRNDPPFLPREDRWYYPPFERSVLDAELWDPIPPSDEPHRLAAELHQRYRRALGLAEESA